MTGKDNLLPRKGLSRNLSEQVAEMLGMRILAGEYPPCATLPEEPALCAEFEVSRTVVREAVRMLVSKGLIEVRPRIGTRVLDPSNWQLLDRDVLRWQQSIPIDGDQLRALIELRQAVEPDAARYAAGRRSDSDMNSITEALARMEEVVERNSEYAIADARFHIAVLRAAKNRYLDAMESAIFTGLLLSIQITMPDGSRNREAIPLHQAIADAIVDADGAAAHRAMTDHLRYSAERLNEILDRG